MDYIDNILNDMPLFRHCGDAEIGRLRAEGRLLNVKRGGFFDPGKDNTLGIVAAGLFEMEAPGRGEVVCMAPGSFFGDIPFTQNRHRGRVRALVDSSLFVIDVEKLYRFFLNSYKAMRGYLRAVGAMGFEPSSVGRKYGGKAARVITVFGPKNGAGKSILSSFLGLCCARDAKTIVLDASYTGDSIFNIFEKRITTAVSQKDEKELSADSFINERIEPVGDRLSLMNIAFGSKVRVNPDIISPILFALSREYRYIVIDLSGRDDALRDRVFDLSDVLFPIVTRPRDRRSLHSLLDSSLREGQRVLYTLNAFHARSARAFEGGIILEDLEIDKSVPAHETLRARADGDSGAGFMEFIRGRKHGMVLEARLADSLAYAGFLAAFQRAGKTADLLYSSGMSFAMAALFALKEDEDSFLEAAESLFSEERLNAMIDITFPDGFVIKSAGAERYARELAGDSRIEMFRTLPAVMLTDGETGGARFFSTGNLAGCIAASFMLHPVCESVEMAGGRYHSGFPARRARPEDLLRADVDEIISISIRNRARLRFREKRVLKFYDSFLDHSARVLPEGRPGGIPSKNLVIELDEGVYNFKKILELSDELSNKLLKEHGL
ncbi:MAG TPA: hypothetical protein PL135_12335 [Spirochaetota bacterium]|nr:hypothetical protein [Spirochaetota bacterium]